MEVYHRLRIGYSARTLKTEWRTRGSPKSAGQTDNRMQGGMFGACMDRCFVEITPHLDMKGFAELSAVLKELDEALERVSSLVKKAESITLGVDVAISEPR